MPSKPARNTPIGPIDGIRRTPRASNARSVALPIRQSPQSHSSSRPALPERPLPKGLTMEHAHTRQSHKQVELVDTGEIVSHPSLPLPTSRPSVRSSSRSSLWGQVLGKSYHVAHDKRSTTAILIATALSPMFWLVVLAPWIIGSILQPQSTGWTQVSSTVHRLLGLSFTSISWRIVLLSLGLFLIWVGRHALLLVSHAVHVRQIDHRLSDSHMFWWAALHKLTRSFSLATIDTAIAGGVFGSIIGLIIFILGRHSSANLFYQGMLVNGLVFLGILTMIIISVHRPLARVMLATSNLSAMQLTRYSFGMIVYNFGRALLLGIWWLAMLGLTFSILIGIDWATLSYSLTTLPHGLLARLILTVFSAGLIYVVLAVFLLWSQGFWSLAYHYLAHRTYPAQVSKFFTTEPHTSKRRTSLLRILIITGFLSVLLSGGIFLARGPLSRAWTQLQASQSSFDEWMNRR